MLSQYYDALSAAGRLVFRKGEDVDVTYPSLVSALRAPATKGSSDATRSRARVETGTLHGAMRTSVRQSPVGLIVTWPEAMAQFCTSVLGLA